ncbi:hypothetical protein OBB02_03770 [Candidatus Puniceispirillum sp.]|nr:hypothetical protein [Candidatus Puniceispirillum sp.]
MTIFSLLRFAALLFAFLSMPFETSAQSANVPGSTFHVADTTVYNSISASGTTVSVSGLDPLKVVVSANSGTLKITTTTGLSAPTGYTSGQWAGASEIAFEGTLSNVNNALATLQYLGAGTITVSPTSSSILYYSGTGNYYEFISNNSSWTAAQSNANGKTYGTSTGYLATVTSSAEFTFIKDKAGLVNEIWLGGSDSGTEGVWLWMGGPENGQQFWQGEGTSATPPGSAVGGFYTSWNGAGEPNDHGGNEDCLAVLTNGLWNDYPCTRNATYVIEYDGSGVNSSQSFQVAALLTNSISLSDINKFVGDTPFDLTNPTSSSAGAFSYTSSNNNVATVSGNTVTVLGSGTSTITVSQASDGTYDAASATATLTVSEGGPNDPEVAFEAIKTNIEETSSDNVYKNSIEHLQRNELTLHEQIMFHSKMSKRKSPPPSDSSVDYNVSFVGVGDNVQSNGHYHHTELVGNKFRRRVLVDAKKVFFKGSITTTVFTSLLLYDYDFLTQNAKQLRLGLKRSNDRRNQTLKYKSEAKTIFVGTGVSHKIRENVFGGFSGDVLYSLTDTTYTNEYTNIGGKLETYNFSASAQLLGQYRSSTLEAFCERTKWCQNFNAEFWIKPALNVSYSREQLIDKEFTSTTKLGRMLVYPNISMPTVARITLAPEFSYQSVLRKGIKRVFSIKPSYACEVLKTNSKTEVCSFGLENKLDLISNNNNFMGNLYINYENLNLGARHEYGVRLKINF